jgi:pimeloyl-ACP methyl ester carboxylesterase
MVTTQKISVTFPRVALTDPHGVGHALRGAGARLALWQRAIARRGALAFQARPAEVRGPTIARLLSELKTPYELWSAGRRAAPTAPVRGPSHPVMLLPGFGTHPARMNGLRRALDSAGHRVADWGLGFNFGPSEDRFDRLCERVLTMARREGQPLVLVGWSLGGLFAREIAHRHPDAVAMVITMGSPFSGDRRANNAWRAYQAITGHAVDAPPVGERAFGAKPPVPTIALWSPRDGIVSPRSSCGRPGERDHAVAMRCTHLGFAGHPDVARMLVSLIGALEQDNG